MTYIKKEDVLEALPEQPQNEVNTNVWISVKERLPKAPNQEYLCYTKRYGISTLEFINELNRFLLDGVTHWQSLPNPPTVD